MKQEKLISHFLTHKHHGTYDDIKWQITDYYEANDRNAEKTFGF